MTTPDIRLKRHMVDLYHLSPVVWAVVKGDLNEVDIATRLGKPQHGVERAVRGAIIAGLLTRSHDRLVVQLAHHRSLYNQIAPRPAGLPLLTHPLIDIIGDKALTTKQCAEAVDRPYHSIYKTLQRLQGKGLLERHGKAWRRRVTP